MKKENKMVLAMNSIQIGKEEVTTGFPSQAISLKHHPTQPNEWDIGTYKANNYSAPHLTFPIPQVYCSVNTVQQPCTCVDTMCGTDSKTSR